MAGQVRLPAGFSPPSSRPSLPPRMVPRQQGPQEAHPDSGPPATSTPSMCRRRSTRQRRLYGSRMSGCGKVKFALMSATATTPASASWAPTDRRLFPGPEVLRRGRAGSGDRRAFALLRGDAPGRYTPPLWRTSWSPSRSGRQGGAPGPQEPSMWKVDGRCISCGACTRGLLHLHLLTTRDVIGDNPSGRAPPHHRLLPDRRLRPDGRPAGSSAPPASGCATRCSTSSTTTRPADGAMCVGCGDAPPLPGAHLHFATVNKVNAAVNEIKAGLAQQ